MTPNRLITIKAIVTDHRGGPDVLRMREMPELDTNQVLVRIHAAGINPADYKISAHASGCSFPFILGDDVAGLVERVGSEVSVFQVGDAVFAALDFSRQGGYAEFVASDNHDVVKQYWTLTDGKE